MVYVKAFVIGGLICVVAQILMDRTNLMPARIVVIYVTLGAILGGLGLYEPLVDFAGAGATVPLTGFGYGLAKGVMAEIDQEGVLGIFTGGLKATAGGITAAIVFGYLASISFDAKPKN